MTPSIGKTKTADRGIFLMRSLWPVLLAVTGYPIGVSAAHLSLTRCEFTQVHMGTEFKIVLYADDQSKGAEAAAAAFERIAQLDAALSDYRPDSELMLVCSQAGG